MTVEIAGAGYGGVVQETPRSPTLLAIPRCASRRSGRVTSSAPPKVNAGVAAETRVQLQPQVQELAVCNYNDTASVCYDFLDLHGVQSGV